MVEPDPRLPHERLFDPPAPPSPKKGCGCLVPALLLAGVTFLLAAAAGVWLLVRAPEPTAEVAGESILDKLRQAADQPDHKLSRHAARLMVEAHMHELRQKQVEHHARTGRYVALPPCPLIDPGPRMVAMDGECAAAWDAFGWKPQQPWCRYQVVLPPGSFRALAECDLDGDGQTEVLRAGPKEAPSWILSSLVE